MSLCLSAESHPETRSRHGARAQLELKKSTAGAVPETLPEAISLLTVPKPEHRCPAGRKGPSPEGPLRKAVGAPQPRVTRLLQLGWCAGHVPRARLGIWA